MCLSGVLNNHGKNSWFYQSFFSFLCFFLARGFCYLNPYMCEDSNIHMYDTKVEVEVMFMGTYVLEFQDVHTLRISWNSNSKKIQRFFCRLWYAHGFVWVCFVPCPQTPNQAEAKNLQFVASSNTELLPIRTEDQIAYIFTKALPNEQFRKLRERLCGWQSSRVRKKMRGWFFHLWQHFYKAWFLGEFQDSRLPTTSPWSSDSLFTYVICDGRCWTSRN